MRIEDQGIVLQILPFEEKKYIATVFTQKNGIYKGVVVKKVKIFSIVQGQWSSRTNGLGFWRIETRHDTFFSDYPSLLTLHIISDLLPKVLAERHPYHHVHDCLISYLESPSLSLFVKFLFLLLSKAGFGLSLNICGVTHVTENLCYISPKTGHAICREKGLPYHDKMFLLPEFLKNNNFDNLSNEEVLQGIELAWYFLEKNFQLQKNDYKNLLLSHLRGCASRSA